MLRALLLLIVVAAVAAYFTRPGEPAMREAASAMLNDPQNMSQGFESIGAALAGDRRFDNYFLASKYTVALGERPLLECWGAFTQVQCSRRGEPGAS